MNVNNGNATMKRRPGGVRNAPDARKMYQEALMVRKVKAYLESVNNNIITDEDVLNRMSVELEPPTNKLSMVASSSSLRSGGRPPSPTPSRGSNLSEGKKSIASVTGLTAESSSVASLPGLRRGSVSSQDSQGGPGEQERGQQRRPELPMRGERPPPAPHRPPDYQTAVRARVARTQSRDYSDTENETQVSAV